MKHHSIIVRALWDDEAKVWTASSSDIDGLAIEAETVELLEKKIFGAVADLLELNGITSDQPEIPVHIVAEHFARIPNPTF